MTDASDCSVTAQNTQAQIRELDAVQPSGATTTDKMVSPRGHEYKNDDAPEQPPTESTTESGAPKPPPTLLGPLPDDLWAHVCSLLVRPPPYRHRPMDVKDLAALCKVNSALREIASHFLYRDITLRILRYSDDELRRMPRRKPHPPALDPSGKFLETIRLKPELGSHVKHLVLDGDCSQNDLYRRIFEDKNPVRRGLALLTDVRRLRLSSFTEQAVCSVLRGLIDNCPQLCQQLSHLEVCDSRRPLINTRTADLLASFPSLITLRLEGSSAGDDFSRVEEGFPHIGNIRPTKRIESPHMPLKHLWLLKDQSAQLLPMMASSRNCEELVSLRVEPFNIALLEQGIVDLSSFSKLRRLHLDFHVTTQRMSVVLSQISKLKQLQRLVLSFRSAHERNDNLPDAFDLTSLPASLIDINLVDCEAPTSTLLGILRSPSHHEARILIDMNLVHSFNAQFLDALYWDDAREIERLLLERHARLSAVGRW